MVSARSHTYPRDLPPEDTRSRIYGCGFLLDQNPWHGVACVLDPRVLDASVVGGNTRGSVDRIRQQMRAGIRVYTWGSLLDYSEYAHCLQNRRLEVGFYLSNASKAPRNCVEMRFSCINDRRPKCPLTITGSQPGNHAAPTESFPLTAAVRFS